MSLPKNLALLPQTNPVKELHTILRNKDTDNSEFIFCAERLMKMVIELGLNQLPYEEILIKTPNASSYSGIKFKRGNTGVSINRSGESFENALRQCCRSIRIGKILIGDDQQVLYTRFMGDIRQRRVLLLYPVLRTGSTVLTAISLLLRNHVKEENIILVTLFSNLKCVEEILRHHQSIRIVTSQITERVPTFFATKYFGTN